MNEQAWLPSNKPLFYKMGEGPDLPNPGLENPVSFGKHTGSYKKMGNEGIVT